MIWISSSQYYTSLERTIHLQSTSYSVFLNSETLVITEAFGKFPGQKYGRPVGVVVRDACRRIGADKTGQHGVILMKQQRQQIQEDTLPRIQKFLDLLKAQTMQVFEALADGEQVFFADVLAGRTQRDRLVFGSGFNHVTHFNGFNSSMP